MSKVLIKTTLAATLALGLSFSAQAAGLWVFGDSLSDSGNNAIVFSTQGGPITYTSAQATVAGIPQNASIPSIPTNIPLVITSNSSIPTFTYASGTYSDGPVWASRYAASAGITLTPSLAGGTNYAYGGAVTSGPGVFPLSLVDQVNQAAARPGDLPKDDLYVIAGGGNNARALVGAIAAGANAATTIATGVQQFVADIVTMLTTLESNGARADRIVVWSAPNLAATPAAQAGGAQSVALADTIAQQMNAALRATLQTSGQASLGVRYFDIYGLATQVPSGINTSSACAAIAAPAVCNPSQYLFYDGIHPTSYGHQVIANSFAALVPVPGAAALMAIGLLGLLSFRRR